MTALQNSFNLTFTGSNVYGKLGLTSPQFRQEQKNVDYCFFHDLVVNPHPYKGLDSLSKIQNSNTWSEERQETNPKTSFYLCKKYSSSVEFYKMPMYLMKRLAYRRKNEVDERNRIIYNDSNSKNYDQIATEYHCLKLLKGSYRAVQLISLLHENIKCKEDKKFFYHSLKLPDRRAKNIKNICFILEEMNKGSLREQLEKNILEKNPFSIEKIIEYTCQMAEGLLELRQKGIIHRDLRPENVLIHNDQIKFTDFDSAFIRGFSDYRNIKNGVDMKDTTPLEIMLLIAESEEKLMQMSSQQLYQKQKKADIYFLGVNIYTMIFNQAFESFNGGKILKNLVNIKKRQGVSPKLLYLMESCLQKDPHTRIDLDEIIKTLSQLEQELYLTSSTYKRVYLSPESLSIQSFTSNDLGRLIKVKSNISEQQNVSNKEQMSKKFQSDLKIATIERNTHFFENLYKKKIQLVENIGLWIENYQSKLFKINRTILIDKIQRFLERMQVKAFYYELTYRVLFQINLAVIKSPIFFENIRTHLELFSSELVVILNFLYETILKFSFTSDPHYDYQNPSYEVRKVVENFQKFYSRWIFFSGRLELQKKVNQQKKKIKQQLMGLKETMEGEELNRLNQFQQDYKVTFDGINIFQSLIHRLQKLKGIQYNSIEQRFNFSYQETNTMKCLEKVESIVKSEMVQTIINLIIAYEEIKMEQWGHKSNLKNTIFMIMILEAQNTSILNKNEIVIIKQELSRMINMKLGWKSEQLEAFFNNYTQTHNDEVIKGLGQLESRAILAAPSQSEEEICIQVLGSDQSMKYSSIVQQKKIMKESPKEVEDHTNSDIKSKVIQEDKNQGKDEVIQKLAEVQQLQLKETFEVKMFSTDLKEREETSKKAQFLEIQENIGVENLESIDLG